MRLNVIKKGEKNEINKQNSPSTRLNSDLNSMWKWRR